MSILKRWNGNSWEAIGPQITSTNFNNIIASEYDPNNKYNIGDCVTKNNKLYRCITETTTKEEWNDTHWQSINLTEQINLGIFNDIVEKNGNPVSIFNKTSQQIVKFRIYDYNHFPEHGTLEAPVKFNQLNIRINNDSDPNFSFYVNMPNNIFGLKELDLINQTAIVWTYIELSGDMLDRLTFDTKYGKQLRLTGLNEINDYTPGFPSYEGLICTHARVSSNHTFATIEDKTVFMSGRTFAFRDESKNSLEEWKTFLQNEYNKGTPVGFIYLEVEEKTIDIPHSTFSIKTGYNSLSTDYGKINISYINKKFDDYIEKKLISKQNSTIIINRNNTLNFINRFTIDNIRLVNNNKPNLLNPATITPFNSFTINLIQQQKNAPYNIITNKYNLNLQQNIYGGEFNILTNEFIAWKYIELSGNMLNRLTFDTKYGKQLRLTGLNEIIDDREKKYQLFCTHTRVSSNHTFATIEDKTVFMSGSTFAFRDESKNSLEEWKTFLQNEYNKGTPVGFIYLENSPTIKQQINLNIDNTNFNRPFILNTNYGVINLKYYGNDDADKVNFDMDILTEPNGTTVYITKIKKHNDDGTFNSLKVGCADIDFNENGDPTGCMPETPTVFSQKKNSPMVMNGGYFARSIGTNIPWGSVISNGEVILDRPYENNHNEYALCIDVKGNFSYVKSSEMDAQELRDNKIIQCFCGTGPLISNKEILTTIINNYNLNNNDSNNVIAYDDKYYYILTNSSRTDENPGINKLRTAQILKNYNVHEAYSMDSGGSTTTVLNGLKINPNIDLSERPVSTVLYLEPISIESEILLNSL